MFWRCRSICSLKQPWFPSRFCPSSWFHEDKGLGYELGMLPGSFFPVSSVPLSSAQGHRGALLLTGFLVLFLEGLQFLSDSADLHSRLAYGVGCPSWSILLCTKPLLGQNNYYGRHYLQPLIHISTLQMLQAPCWRSRQKIDIEINQSVIFLFYEFVYKIHVLSAILI